MGETLQGPHQCWNVSSKNPNSIFYNVQHAFLDFNLQTQYHTSFTLRIQTSWQLQIMQKFGHGSLISFDATIGMPFFYCMKCHKINMFHNIVINV
jgi:hypothetical protein